MKIKKLFIPVFTLTLLAGIGGITAKTTLAEETATPELTIYAQNLCFEENVHILYAVKTENVTENDEFGLLVWNTPNDSYTYGTQNAVLKADSEKEEIEGVECSIFTHADLAAKQMTDVVYTRAYVERDGNYYYSEVKKYSILEYAYNMLGKTEATPTNDSDLVALLNATLAYGAASQSYFNYNTDKLATDNFTYVRINNAKFEDGFSYGLYKAGEKIKIFPDEGYALNTGAEDFKTDENGDFILTVPKEKTMYEDALVDANCQHTYTESEYFAGYCIKNGYTKYKCSLCGNTYKEEFPAIYGHSYNNIEIVSDKVYTYEELELIFGDNLTGFCFFDNIRGTCTIIGEGVCFCEYCDDALHIYAYGTHWEWHFYYDDTHHWIECNECGETKEIAQHEIDEYGFCSVCGYEVTDGVLYAISADGMYAEVIGFEDKTTEIKIADTYNGLPVKTIYNNAFKETSIVSVIIPDSVTSIGNSAFFGCSSLTSVNIGGSVTEIGNYAFDGCSSLTNITLPHSVTSIGWSAFLGCSNLTNITIPNNVTEIGRQAFYGCTSLSFETFDNAKYLGNENNPYFALIEVINQNYSSYIIQESTKIIADFVFYNCKRVANIIIPDSVTSIGEGAFYYCESLTSITIGNSVTSIGEGAFAYCESLTSVTFSDTATWHRTLDKSNWKNKTGGYQIDVTDTSTCIDYLKNYWYLYKL